jgi:hypothetical protein
LACCLNGKKKGKVKEKVSRGCWFCGELRLVRRRIMEKRTTIETVAESQDENVVLMYPGNQLKEQVRDFGETLSAFSVVHRAFFSAK